MGIIITIGREFGSGGRELGKRIAEYLGIAYYDKEILTEISKKTELAFDYVRQIVENKPIIYYPISIGNSFNTIGHTIGHNTTTVFLEQSNVIKEMAVKSDCVIVGRCADYILRDYHPFRIFVYADMKSKTERCREKGEFTDRMSDRKMRRKIKAVDRNRGNYYEFYTSQKWGDKLNYDLCINTSGHNIKELANEIAGIFRKETS